ncbi:MAG: hypothetical protein ABSB28_00970 [Candidatus Bathyarchaeia archaeon]
MSEAITGLAARFYAFASKRISLIKDFHDTVADEILGRISSGTVLDIGTGPGDLLEKVASLNRNLGVRQKKIVFTWFFKEEDTPIDKRKRLRLKSAILP